MAGKSKCEKAKRARTKKRLREELIHGNKVVTKIKELIAEEPHPEEILLKPFDDCPEDCENFGHCENTEGCMERLEEEELGNNAEPIPKEINEDAGKDAEMMVESDPALIGEQLAMEAGLSIKFDPDQVIANLLKKKVE